MEHGNATNERTESPKESEQAPSTTGEPVPASCEVTGTSKERLRIGKRLLRLVWMPVKVFAYVGLLSVMVFSLLWGLERFAEWSLRRSFYGQMYAKDFSKVRLDFTEPVSHYDYDLAPGVCLIRS